MTPSRYTFASDIDEETQQILDNQHGIDTRLALTAIEIPVSSLSPDGSIWYHAVEAVNDKNVIKIRVITSTHRGVTVSIPVTSPVLYHKFRDLRFQIRNSDNILVSFDVLFVLGSPIPFEIRLKANDFKVYNPDCDKTVMQAPKIII